MRIIDRYIAVTLLKTTLLALFVLITLFAFLSLIDQLEEAGRGHYHVIQAIQYVLLTTPRLAYELIPIAAVIGSMATLGILSHNSELTVLRTSGVSKLRLGFSMCKGGVLLILLAAVIGELIAPYSEQTAQHLRSIALTEQITLKTKYGFWSRDGLSFINIRKILPGDQIEDIYIYEFDDDDQLRTSTYAKRAKYVDSQWLLEDIEQITIHEENVSKQQSKLAAWESLLNPDVINLVTIQPQYLTLWGLFNYISYLKQNEQNSQRYEQALWSKIINPFTIIVMIILAVPLVKSHTTTTAVGQRVFTGCLIGIVFHICNQVAGQLGVVYSINPAISAAVPTILMSVIVIWLFHKAA
ncbi:MAG: export transporter permease LptG [Gammaproteobacteria bacterium]|nr:export transporter permease LptG [Gammaproteobacteria bacterium]